MRHLTLYAGALSVNNGVGDGMFWRVPIYWIETQDMGCAVDPHGFEEL